jgi:hypothetical protein
VQAGCAEWGTMSSLPVDVAVFFGKVDKRPSGWYWAATSKPEKPFIWPIAGPFETKAQAIENAVLSVNTAHEQRGASQ